MKTTLRNTVCGLSIGAVLTLVGANALAQSRDYISVVGSSTVYPFSTVVAERFGKAAGGATPKVESTGTGGGFTADNMQADAHTLCPMLFVTGGTVSKIALSIGTSATATANVKAAQIHATILRKVR